MTAKPAAHPLPCNRPSAGGRGFALVATLTMMVLLSVLALGLLSLSAVTLRSSSQGSAMAEARSNARMTLMMALASYIANLARTPVFPHRTTRAALPTGPPFTTPGKRIPRAMPQTRPNRGS